MAFLLGGWWKKKSKVETRLTEDQTKCNELIEENKSLRHNLADQVETTIQNKNLLENYILSSAQDNLIEELNSTIMTLEKQVEFQDNVLKDLQ